MFQESTPSSFVTITVPTELYADVIRLVADSLPEGLAPESGPEEDDKLSGAAAVNGPVDEIEAGTKWPVEDFARFGTTQTKTTLLVSAVMDVLAERPGERVSTTELVERLEVERKNLRSALSALTRHVKKHYPGQGWPFSWEWGGKLGSEFGPEMYYNVHPETAARWKQARNA